MKIFITSGTPEFMVTLQKKHSKEQLFIMHGAGNSVLLHETEGKSIFQTPRRFEVIGSIGAIEEAGYFAFTNIPVTDEGKPVFEDRFASAHLALGEEPGFIAFRLLRPLDSDTYVIFTQWSDPFYYNRWKHSPTFRNSAFAFQPEKGVANTLHLFTSAPYTTTYQNKLEEQG